MSTPSKPAEPQSWSEWKAWIGKRRWLYPFARAEWASEWIYYRLRSLALFDLLELAGRCTVLVVAIFWVLEADNRAKESHYRAWALINAARGSTGDGGRRDALQDLKRDDISLADAPLEQAYLVSIDLRKANLFRAHLQGAFLNYANLQDADLQWANLQGAILYSANLRHARLYHANLQGAKLENADLQAADLDGANLQDARDLTQEQLNKANGSNLTVLPKGLTRPGWWGPGFQ